ncbi:MAG: hypothetical protein KC731_40690, partial [Myxococcales bacterium]|nr:hypothetical protein [Myxococcales bacterium]
MRPLFSFATPLVLALALAAAPALAAGASLADATPEQVAAARGPYVEAKKAFDAGDYAAAQEGFAASYAIVASPNSHLMMAKALEKLERFADAYREAKAVLPEAEAAVAVDEKYARTADDARALVEDMRRRVGYLTVRLPYGETGAVTVAGRRLAAEELDEPILVDPGPVTVSFDGPRGVESRTMTLGKGGTGLIDFGKREDAPPTPSPIE